MLKVLELGPNSGPHYIALTPDEKRLVISDYFLNEDEFGLDNTVRFLQHSRYMNLQSLHSELLKEIKEFCQGADFEDDITLLSCRFK